MCLCIQREMLLEEDMIKPCRLLGHKVTQELLSLAADESPIMTQLRMQGQVQACSVMSADKLAEM